MTEIMGRETIQMIYIIYIQQCLPVILSGLFILGQVPDII